MVSHVDESVASISNESAQLNEGITVIDKAMKDVEASNTNLVGNMKQINEIMETMTQGVLNSEASTMAMLSKYDETSANVIKIEDVVGKLVEELGEGGFMGLNDIKPEMVVTVTESGSDNPVEYTAEVTDVTGHHILIGKLMNGIDVLDVKDRGKRYDVSIVVNNALYKWENVKVQPAKHGYIGVNSISINGKPKVFNRRKYPRYPLVNRCKITMKGDSAKTYEGKMIDVSANGFAFSTFESEFADAREKLVEISVNGFKPMEGKKVEGRIIRVSDHGGEYLIGARMLQDDMDIKEYVEQKLAEGNARMEKKVAVGNG
jgi:methyl-accepting chemotaxis protein